MSTIAEDDVRVVAGIDTHKEFHVVVVLDELGRQLDMATFAATPRGYRELTGWVTDFGEVLAIGVEGTCSWGAGLCRHLRERGLNVIEVNQPDRHKRRRKGKSDRLDAEVAARAVLAGDATALPKSGDGPVEALRQIRIARAGAMKARTAAANQLHSVCDTAPDQIRSQLRGLSTRRKIAIASRYRPGDPLTPTGSPPRRASRRCAAPHPCPSRPATPIDGGSTAPVIAEATPRCGPSSWPASAVATRQRSNTSNGALRKDTRSATPSAASNASSHARSTATSKPSQPPKQRRHRSRLLLDTKRRFSS